MCHFSVSCQIFTFITCQNCSRWDVSLVPLFLLSARRNISFSSCSFQAFLIRRFFLRYLHNSHPIFFLGIGGSTRQWGLLSWPGWWCVGRGWRCARCALPTFVFSFTGKSSLIFLFVYPNIDLKATRVKLWPFFGRLAPFCYPIARLALRLWASSSLWQLYFSSFLVLREPQVFSTLHFLFMGICRMKIWLWTPLTYLIFLVVSRCRWIYGCSRLLLNGPSSCTIAAAFCSSPCHRAYPWPTHCPFSLLM